MSEWLFANAGVSNGLMLVFTAGCLAVLAFSAWAMGIAGRQLRKATAFYEAYLADSSLDLTE